MKKNNILNKLVMAALLVMGYVTTTSAQSTHLPDRLSLQLDWQMNAPISGNFGNKFSVWGAGFETHYEITRKWSLGAFVNFHTNHKYVERQTLPISPTEALTTDQQQSAFQLPFGLSGRYTICDNGYFKPYIGLKAGAMYAQNSSYLNTVRIYERPWGFYVSPELGMNIYPQKYGRFGFHAAVYYNFATNKTDLLTYTEDSKQNIGVRLGITF